MSFFGVSAKEQYDTHYSVLSQAADTTAREREMTPDVFEGAGGAVATGAFRGLSRSAASLGNVATPLLRPGAKKLDDFFGTSFDDYLVKEQDKANKALIDSKLDPQTTGMAGNFLYGITDLLTTTVASGGNPYAVAGVYGTTQAQLGIAEGLDTTTAVLKGAVEGITTGIAVGLPAALKGGLAVRASSGAGINVATDVVQRVGVSTVLKSNGYDEMAKQYDILDLNSLAANVVLGAAFGAALGSKAVPKSVKAGAKEAPSLVAEPSPIDVPPSAVDAALVTLQQRHLEIDAAPGIPANTLSRQSHVAAMDQAMTSLLNGDAVNVQAVVRDAKFVDKPMMFKDLDITALVNAELERAGAPQIVAELRRMEAEAEIKGLSVEADAIPADLAPREEMPIRQTIARNPAVESTEIRRGSVAKVEETTGAKNEIKNEVYSSQSMPGDILRIVNEPDGARVIQETKTRSGQEINPHLYAAALRDGDIEIRSHSKAAYDSLVNSGSAKIVEREGKSYLTLNKENIALKEPALLPPEVENPSMEIPDSSGKMVNAAESMAHADAEITKAKELSQGFGIAAECAMRFGT